MNRLLPLCPIVLLFGCNPGDPLHDGGVNQSALDIAPQYTTPGAYRCPTCPDLPGATFETNVGAVTSTQLDGTVTGAVGNGQFYIRGRNGEEIVGVLPTATDGSFASAAPLFCGEQIVKCLWNNAAGSYVLVRKIITTNCVDADVRVTLSWDAKARDLELHLIKPGGRINDQATKTDCTWTTCIGTGLFQVMVEHWAAGEPLNDARLIINVKGKPATVFDRKNLVPQHVWRAATISWPEGKVTAVDSDFDCTASWSSGCTAMLP